jgi:protein phosphatase
MNCENMPDKDNAGGRSLRLLRPSMVVLCGPAACGKSTFAARHFRPTQIISSDWARARVSDDERDQRFNAQAFALVHFLVEQRLTVNRLCVIDSTALTWQARKDLLDLAKKYQVPTTLLVFNVPLETCIERDEKRERSVGRAIIERQYQAFEQSKETIRQEGFGQVLEFQDGDLEKVQIEILFRPVARPAPRPPRAEASAPRRFERSAQPSRLRQSGRGDNGHSASSASVPHVVQPAATPRPTPTTGSVATAKVGTARSGGVPASVAGIQPPSAARLSASPAVAEKPSLASTAVEPTKAVSPVAPRPDPVDEAHSSDRS